MWALENGYQEIAQLLIDKRANINARNKTGWTALIWASVNGHKDIVELLIKNGANLNIKNNDGWSALVGAVFKNHYNIAKLLIDNGITINAEDKYLISALIFTYDKGYNKMFELLFNAGVNSENIQDKEGNNTLLMATRLGLINVVKSLLDNGANINRRNKNNYTALIWATVKNHKEMVKLLLKYKPKLNFIDNDRKWSALMYASAWHQTKDIVELLVNAGANINQTYNREEKIKEYPYHKYFNRTSLTLSKENKYKNINGIEEFLKSKGAIITS
jgi:serine/threonine-protein phosphatase 6 regulatory ankyrin repeat subunit B